MAAGGDKIERTCPYCGSIVTAEDFFCRACHKRFELQGAATDQTRDIGLPEGSVLSLRNPVVAAFFSFLGMGFGQFYNGDTVKGLLFNAVYLPVVLGYLDMPVMGTAIVAVWGISIIEAPITSWRINHLATDYSGPSILFWVQLVVLAGLFVWYLFSGDAYAWVNTFYPAVHFLD